MKNKILYILGLFLVLQGFSFAQNDDDFTVYYNKGIDSYEQEKYDESITFFKKAIEVDPAFYDTYYNLARAYEMAGKDEEAIKMYEKTIEMDPEDYENIYQYCELLSKSGYFAKTLLNLKRIPKDSEFRPQADELISKTEAIQKEFQEKEAVAKKAKEEAKAATNSVVIGSVPAPSGLVVDSTGNVYVASFSDNKIIKLNTSEEKTVFADKTNGIDGPIGLDIDSKDNIYVTNYNKGNVIVFNKNGEDKVLLHAKKPYGVHVSEKENKIYVTEQGNNSIIQYDISDILGEPVIEADVVKTGEKKVIQTNINDGTPIGVPSITESEYSRQSPQNSMLAPIMVPSTSAF